MKENIDYTAVELFSGPGGLALGFHMAGFRSLAAYDYEQDCIDTYQANFQDTVVKQKNLADFSESDLNELLDIIEKKTGNCNHKVSIVMGGPPCRSFSTSNPKKSHGDHRDLLYKQLIGVADKLDAKYFLMENVEDITTKSVEKDGEKKIFHCLLEDLYNSGFKYINFKVLNSDNYGIPQSRERLIIIATKDANIVLNFPNPETPDQNSKVNVLEAFQDLPRISAHLDDLRPGEDQKMIKAFKTDRTIYYCDSYKNEPINDYTRYCRGEKNSYGYRPFSWSKHNTDILSLFIVPNHQKRIIQRYHLLNEGETQGTLFKRLKNEKSFDEIEKLTKERVLPKKIFKQKNRRLFGNMPSNTVTSHAREELVHPLYNRNLTAREVARLQSFPDWYQFKGVNQKPFKPSDESDLGTGRDFYQQIGDAVPPLLAAAIAKEIKKCLNTTKPALYGDFREKLVRYIWESTVPIRDFNNSIQSEFKMELSDLLSGETYIDTETINIITNKLNLDKIVK